MHRRLRWRNVAKTAGALTLVAIVVAWPRLAPPEPSVLGSEAAPVVEGGSETAPHDAVDGSGPRRPARGWAHGTTRVPSPGHRRGRERGARRQARRGRACTRERRRAADRADNACGASPRKRGGAAERHEHAGGPARRKSGQDMDRPASTEDDEPAPTEGDAGGRAPPAADDDAGRPAPAEGDDGTRGPAPEERRGHAGPMIGNGAAETEFGFEDG
jgi:hypothetical protein